MCVLSVFGLHDRAKFEIFCYSLTSHDGSQWRDKIEEDAERFKDISHLSAVEASQVPYPIPFPNYIHEFLAPHDSDKLASMCNEFFGSRKFFF
jgi:hypothetical protein